MYVANRTNRYLSTEITPAQADALTEWDRAVSAYFGEHGTHRGPPPYPAGCPADVALPLEGRTPDDAAMLAVLSARRDFERENPSRVAPPPLSPAEAYRQELARCVAESVPR